jgi:hypothetical protein
MKSDEAFDPFDYPTLCLYAACIELGLRWLHDRARPPRYSRLRILPGRAASGHAVLALYALGMFFVTACGPAFQSDLFEGEKDGAVSILEQDGGVLDASAMADSTQTFESDARHPEGSTPSGSDAATLPLDAALEACSCAELCSGAYPLRACQSCYQETCPTWEGGLPE